MKITEAIIKTANEYGRLHGYILVGKGELDAAKSRFWGNVTASIGYKHETGERLAFPYVKYILPAFEGDEAVEKHGIPKVDIDMHFGNPRINIRTKDFDFCCLTYNLKSGKFSEAQAFGDKGIELAMAIKLQIENNLKQKSDE